MTSVIQQVNFDDNIQHGIHSDLLVDDQISNVNDTNFNNTININKDKLVIETEYTVKTFLHSVAADNVLATILKYRTFKANKIILEGSIFSISICYTFYLTIFL